MAQPSITVSQLKCAVLDPAWRAAYLKGENPPTMVFAPTGQMQVFANPSFAGYAATRPKRCHRISQS